MISFSQGIVSQNSSFLESKGNIFSDLGKLFFFYLAQTALLKYEKHILL